MPIETHVIEGSSNIAEIAYDPETQTLEVEFHHGGRYQYSDFPADVWVQFKNSESKGKFFYRNIKNGGYAYTKL